MPANNYVSGRSKKQLFLPIHPAREMRFYQVSADELNLIAAFNGVSTLFCSLSLSFASFGIGLWSNIFAAGNPSDLTKEYGHMLEAICAALFVLFAALAWWFANSRKSSVRQIKAAHGEDVRRWYVRVCQAAFRALAPQRSASMPHPQKAAHPQAESPPAHPLAATAIESGPQNGDPPAMA